MRKILINLLILLSITNIAFAASDGEIAFRVFGKPILRVILVMIFLYVVQQIYTKMKNRGTDNNTSMETEEVQESPQYVQKAAQVQEEPFRNTVVVPINKSTSQNPQRRLGISDLRELKQLLDEGVITQEDFDRVKKKILG